MKTNTLLSLLSAHLKAVTVAGVAIAATAGGGAVVATTVADSQPTTTVTTSADNPDGTTPTDVTSTESSDPQDTESPDAQETESPDAEDAGKTGSGSTVTPVDCGTTAWKNHGAFVSSVAHATPSAGMSHGDMVSAAAQSDCGKPTPDSTDSPDSPKAHPTHSAQGDSHRNSNATSHKSATHGKSAAHKHH